MENHDWAYLPAEVSLVIGMVFPILIALLGHPDPEAIGKVIEKFTVNKEMGAALAGFEELYELEDRDAPQKPVEPPLLEVPEVPTRE